jgi:heme transport system ATP-binding protein
MKRTILFLLCCSALAIGGCSRFHNRANNTTAARYIVISPIYNEIIWALGAQDSVVGIDLSTTYPPEVKNEKIVGEVMQHFDVTEFSERNYQTLSGGERQRVNFARVLAQLWNDGVETKSPARYLFLDEPLTFLDIRHQIDFLKKIRKFTDAPDVVTVGVVHDLNLAARFADQIVLLNEGRVVAAGKPADVLTADRIEAVFAVKPMFIVSEHSGLHLVFD